MQRNYKNYKLDSGLLSLRSLLAIVIVFAAALLPLGGQIQAKDSTIIAARGVDADILDVHFSTTTQSGQVCGLIYDNLVTLDAESNLHPGLAESWEISEDKLTYTFKIRDGLQCHDGSIFDAEAAKWNLDRLTNPKHPSPNVSSLGPISNYRVEGDKLIINHSKPYGPFLTLIGSMNLEWMCPSSVEGDSFKKPIGTGPWKFVEWVRNDHIKLERNPNYRNFHPLVKNPGPPHEKYLVIRVIPEAVARMAALQTDEVHFVEPSLEEAAKLAKDPDYTVDAAKLSGQQLWAAFTWRIPPLDDPRVRQAVGYALDRNLYAKVAFEGLVEPGLCPIAPRMFSSDQDKCAEWGQSYNPERAIELLKEAGYGPKNPINVVLSVHKLPGWDLMHQMMQQHLKAVGINAKIETREVAAFFDHMRTENHRTEGPPVIWTMGYSGPDADYIQRVWHRPGFVEMGLNEEVDRMTDEQRVLVGQERLQKLLEIHKYLLTKAYCIPLLSPGWNWLMVSRSNITGFRQVHVGTLKFNDVRLPD